MDFFSDALSVAVRLILQGDAEVYRIVWTSLEISLFATLGASILAIPLGVWLALREFPGKRLVRQSLNALMALPTVVVGLMLYGLFSRAGPLGIWGLLYTKTAVVIGEMVLIVPLVANLSLTAVLAWDRRLIDTLRGLGASPWAELRWVISETRFALLAAVIMGFGRAIGEVGAAMMLGGNILGVTRTMTTAIALETGKGNFELGLALGAFLLLLAFLVNFGLQWLQGDGR